MSKLYTDDGWLYWKYLVSLPVDFIFIVGARGVGKTYGAMKELLVVSPTMFIYTRRLNTQCEIIRTPDMSPLIPINKDFHTMLDFFPINKYVSGIYDYVVDDNGKVKPCGQPKGYMAALSTFSNLRGFDGTELDYWIHDEFIPEKQERPIKNEATALFNAYETLNRNRELTGRPALKLVCMANANTLGNDIFLELGLVKTAWRMRENGESIYIDKNRSLALIILNKSPISEKKKHTALYRLTAGTSYSDMALNNDFAYEEVGRIRSRNLREYRPLVTVGEITIYKHKSRQEYYVTTHRSGSPESYSSGEIDRARFCRKYLHIWQAYMNDLVEFEEYLCEVLFRRYFD